MLVMPSVDDSARTARSAKQSRFPQSVGLMSRVNYICRFLLPHSEMLPKL